MKTKSVIMLLAAALLSMGVAQAQKVSKSDETVVFKPYILSGQSESFSDKLCKLVAEGNITCLPTQK